ncbi:hypothetical protein LGH83_13830 [Lichenihabitans sp. PAMC28606]|uniref:hypothetical protein n=1 Tax=Lichenihabitans sp. PAMC28606 TaxID=2880932 RepID=UPI001D0BCAAE|nr:hypothetical protein [Lichenihabitans sp. PAMC28606]UDL93641.1 hypothetical protein LGH83_13830 [Lichenihabitans sp. PAMC28606]
MRKIILFVAAFGALVSAPAWSADLAAPYRSYGLSDSSLRFAEQIIISHHLLTPDQLACSTLVRGDKAIKEATEVVVLEKHGGACPGDPRLVQARFDLYVDEVSGSVQWNIADPMVLQSIP